LAILIITAFILSSIFWIQFPEITFDENQKLANIIWTIYNGYVGLIQDTLSHMRLFGISLSGAILALVVNEISSMFPIFFQIPFCLFGHMFVFCLSLLSLYVHSNRLIFLEFGSNCINGGHFYYLPLGRS
jgi:vacuolar-type H+-ATPase subunit I/STV1